MKKINELADDLHNKYPNMFVTLKPDSKNAKQSLSLLCYSLKCAMEDGSISNNVNIMKIVVTTHDI